MATGVSIDIALRALLRQLLREELPAALRTAMPALLPALSGTESTEEDSYLTIDEAARLIAVHPATVRKFIRQGRLRSCGTGHLCRVRRRHLDEFMARGHGPKLVVDTKEKAQLMVVRALGRKPRRGS